jgi:hypothetical protein
VPAWPMYNKNNLKWLPHTAPEKPEEMKEKKD